MIEQPIRMYAEHGRHVPKLVLLHSVVVGRDQVREEWANAPEKDLRLVRAVVLSSLHGGSAPLAPLWGEKPARLQHFAEHSERWRCLPPPLEKGNLQMNPTPGRVRLGA